MVVEAEAAAEEDDDELNYEIRLVTMQLFPIKGFIYSRRYITLWAADGNYNI